MPPKKGAKPKPKANKAEQEKLEKAVKQRALREKRDREQYYMEAALEPEEETLEKKLRRQKKEMADNKIR